MKINEIEYLNQVQPDKTVNITASYDMLRADDKGGISGMILGYGKTHDEAKANLLNTAASVREELLRLTESVAL